jgi:hypothetical protein
MDMRRRREQLERDHDAAKFHFIATELDMALTFCEMAIARTTNTRLHGRRNMQSRLTNPQNAFCLGRTWHRE